jgi:hypothetical protein
MGQIRYRANLTSSLFPFDSGNFGRTVIASGQDQYASEGNPGIPQVYYVQNAIPTEFGYKSVGLFEIIPSIPGGTNRYIFDWQRISFPTYFRSSQYVYAVANLTTNVNEFAIYNFGSNTWIFTATGTLSAKDTFSATMTSATVNGRVFVTFPTSFPASTHFFELAYGGSIPSFIARQLTGLPTIAGTSQIDGIFASRGRLLVWSNQQNLVAWSSLTNPLDFAPSLITGAGNTQIQDARGRITHCVPTLYGFIVYCEDNVIAAEYTGNLAAPWSFREIYNSSGIISYEHVTRDNSVDTQFSWTDAGITKISDNVAQGALAELGEVIRRKKFYVYNSTTKKFSLYDFSANTLLSVAVSAVGKRYVAISIPNALWTYTEGVESGPPTISARNKYSYCFLFDSILKRWTLIKVGHNAIATLAASNFYDLPYDNNLAFLTYDGSVDVMRTCDQGDTPEAYLVLGKYQFSRTRKSSLQEVQLENLAPHTTLCTILTSLDGKTITSSLGPTEDLESNINYDGQLKKFPCDIVGENHSIVLSGEFDVNTVLLTGYQHGRL